MEHLIIAAIGGFTYNVVPLLELWKTPKQSRPNLGEWLYWLPYFIWPLLAAFLLYLYEEKDFTPSKLIAFHIGITAPLAIRKFMEVLPIIPSQVTLRDKDQ
ncbi:MAG: hypothetical protein RBR35_19385 [Salinivirgaceae bacterium]|nr:hypothetical protein [Salinivirgaceae bacterium]